MAQNHTRNHTSSTNTTVDHDLSWSLYFLDPDDNRIEVTTYDYDELAPTR